MRDPEIPSGPKAGVDLRDHTRAVLLGKLVDDPVLCSQRAVVHDHDLGRWMVLRGG